MKININGHLENFTQNQIIISSKNLKYKELQKVRELQLKYNKDINVKIEITKKRTLDQNRLLWSLYTIEAREQNGNIGGHRFQEITPRELYDQDLIDYAPKMQVKCKTKEVEFIKENYKIMSMTQIDESIVKINFMLTSSNFNTYQMTKWIERLFNRLAYNGVSLINSEAIGDYWLKWRNYINDEKIVVYEDLITLNQYRKLNPICEATGKFIGHGGGHIAHIKARGMGGNHETVKDNASNLLHLSFTPHIEEQHQKGWTKFLEKYPHLAFKVRSALRKEL